MHGHFFPLLESQFSQNMTNYQDLKLVTANNKGMLAIIQIKTKKTGKLIYFENYYVCSITLKLKKDFMNFMVKGLTYVLLCHP